MPYIVRFQSCNLEPAQHEIVDPLTGWGRPSFVNRGLTDAERQAVLACLLLLGARRLGIDDRVKVRLRDGTTADVNLGGLYTHKTCTGGTLTAAAVSPAVLTLAFELARLGRFLFTPDGSACPLVTSEKLRLFMCVPYPRVQSVFTANALCKRLLPVVPTDPEGKVADPSGE